jgi:hypothetical protein
MSFCVVSAAFINHDFLRDTIFFNGLLKKGVAAASSRFFRPHEINDIADFIHGPV